MKDKNIAAMQMALDWIDWYKPPGYSIYKVARNLREALATIDSRWYIQLPKKQEVAQLLEATESILMNDGGEGSNCYSALRLYDARQDAKNAITALREALAQPQEPSKDAEDYLRGKYGAHRAHPEWRALEQAFDAGMKAQPQGEPVANNDPYNGDDGHPFDEHFHAQLLAGAHLLKDDEQTRFIQGWNACREFMEKNTPPVVPQGEDDMMIAYMVGYEKGKDETKEKAARVCEEKGRNWNDEDGFCFDCAAAIRGLK